jgi:hypothetical protein
MDLIDEQKITALVVNPALDRIKTEIIPAFEAIAQKTVADVATALQASIGGALIGISRLIEEVDGDASKLLDGLDGWSLQIQVRLTRPKAGA